jgi:hypothetical protein
MQQAQGIVAETTADVYEFKFSVLARPAFVPSMLCVRENQELRRAAGVATNKTRYAAGAILNKSTLTTNSQV